MSDLAYEYNTYGKRKWSQIATEIWDVPQVQKVLMKKAKSKYQHESYPCVKIACAIDSGRGCNLSVYKNIVNVERGKNKRRQCLLCSSSTIYNTMEVAEEMMALKSLGRSSKAPKAKYMTASHSARTPCLYTS
jgi:hypothetical protein